MSDGTLLDDGTVEGLSEGCSDGMPEGLGVGMEDGSLEAVVATGSVTVGGSTTAFSNPAACASFATTL